MSIYRNMAIFGDAVHVVFDLVDIPDKLRLVWLPVVLPLFEPLPTKESELNLNDPAFLQRVVFPSTRMDATPAKIEMVASAAPPIVTLSIICKRPETLNLYHSFRPRHYHPVGNQNLVLAFFIEPTIE